MGILTSLAVSVTNSIISNNTSSSERGGGIYKQFGGALTITNTTIIGNMSADEGGGIYVLGTASFSIIGSTISNNIANPNRINKQVSKCFVV